MEITFVPPMAIQNVKLEPKTPLAWPYTLASKQTPTASPAATVKDAKVTSVVVLDADTGELMLDVKLVDWSSGLNLVLAIALLGYRGMCMRMFVRLKCLSAFERLRGLANFYFRLKLRLQLLVGTLRCMAARFECVDQLCIGNRFALKRITLQTQKHDIGR